MKKRETEFLKKVQHYKIENVAGSVWLSLFSCHLTYRPEKHYDAYRVQYVIHRSWSEFKQWFTQKSSCYTLSICHFFTYYFVMKHQNSFMHVTIEINSN
jgi:hypothetical protein